MSDASTKTDGQAGDHLRRLLHLSQALSDVALLRRRVPGMDMVPEATAFRLWPVFVHLYTILEIMLKTLARREVEGYDKNAQRDDKHMLSAVFNKLSAATKDAMRENYSQIMSLVRCGGSQSGFLHEKYRQLDAYLRALDNADGQHAGKGQGAVIWRYALLDQANGSLNLDLPPAHADVMHEIARHALRLLRTPQGGADKMREAGFARHIAREAFRMAQKAAHLQFESPAPGDSDAMTHDDYIQWCRQGGGFLNAALKHMSVGPLLRYEKESVRLWANRMTQDMASIASSERTRNSDLEFLFAIAKTIRIHVDGRDTRFKAAARRPQDIRTSFHEWADGWRLRWERNGQCAWAGPLPLDEPLRLPNGKGDVFNASWRDWHAESERPPCDAIVEQDVGVLVIQRKIDAEDPVDVLRADAMALCAMTEITGGIVSGDGGMEDGPSTEFLGSVEFLLIDPDDWAVDTDGSWSNKRGHSPYKVRSDGELHATASCSTCQGTGFCPDCLGAGKASKECIRCGEGAQGQGLCCDCVGYGSAGDLQIARSIGRAPS